MEKNPLRISRWLATLAAAAIVVGCANAPQQQPAPEPEPVAAPEPVVVKPDAPQKYVVVKGDTLWDISSRFLSDPWRWPEVWDSNPQVENPHLIYPGDILILGYKDGRPVIQIHRGGIISSTTPRGIPEQRLSPRVRAEGLDRPIATIPLDAIRPFLTRPRVVSLAELEAAPYIVSSVDRHLIAGAGHRIYVRGLTDVDLTNYVVIRPGVTYRDPETREILGYEAIYLGDAQLKDFGDVSTLQITSSAREVLNGDLLLPANDTMPDTNFMPRAPKDKVRGQIISVPGGVSLIGQYQVVAINLGQQEGMEPGHVLAVYQAGDMVRDRRRGYEQVKMPDEHAGNLMVFRTFARVSYGLVLKATRTMHVNDVVTNP